ncbi:MAG: FlgD ig protein [Dehalococcoidia bacterium]|nr:FlgD ig protein [Dehalococcoidia bacterium]
MILLGVAIGTLVLAFSGALPPRGFAPLTSTTALASPPVNVSQSEEWRFWKYEDVKALDPWGDSENDARDLVAVYFKQTGVFVYFRVDLLDMQDESRPNLYLAVDYKPGGERALRKGDQTLAADIPWDLLLSLSEAGQQSALDADYADHPAYFARVTADTQLDYVEFALSPEALSGWDGKPFDVQALVTDGGSTSVIDKTVPASTEAAAGRGKLVLEFGNMFAGYGPHAVSWYDGYAFPHPERPEERTGLKYLLDAIETYELPLTTNDMRLDVLAANDYLGINDRLRSLAQRGLFDPLPTLTYGYFMPWQPADVDAVAFGMARQAWEEFGLPQGQVFYPYEAMLTAGDLEGIKQAGYSAVFALDRYGYWFGWINDWGNADEVRDWFVSSRKIHQVNGVLVLPGLQGFMWDPRWNQTPIESGWHLNRYDSFEGTDGGLHHGWRRVLLDMALDPDQEQYITMGTDLTLTSWYLPGEAERSARWIASHPWIEATTLDGLLRKNWTPVDHGDLGLGPDQPLERYTVEGDGHYNTYFWQFYYGGVSDGHSPLIPAGVEIEGYFDYVPYLRNGQRIPSGMKMGDDKTPGTIVYETLGNLRAAPDGNLTRLAWYAYFLNVAEGTFHAEFPWKGGEDPAGNIGGAYLHPGAKVKANLLRQANKIVAGARWAEEVARGALSPSTELLTLDIDLDGEDEYVLRNDKVFAIFENDGGVLEYAFAYDPSVGPVQLVGPTYNLILSGLRNYEEGESPIPFPTEETAFEDGEAFRYAVFDVTLGDQSVSFTSPDGRIRKNFTLEGNTILAHYSTRDLSEVYIYFTLPVNPSSMFSQTWWEKLTRVDSKEAVGWQNAHGGYAAVNLMDTSLVETPSFLDFPAGEERSERRDLPYPRGHWLFFPYHTVFVRGTGEFDLGLTLAAVPPTAPVPTPTSTPAPAPVATPPGTEEPALQPTPTASLEATSSVPTPSSQPSGPQPVHLAIFAGLLLLLGVGVTVALRRWRRRE